MDKGALADLLSALPLPALLIGSGERVVYLNVPATTLLGAGLEGRHYITALRQPGLLDTIEQVRGDGVRRQVDFVAHGGDRDTSWATTVAPAGAALLVTFEDRTAAEEAGQMRRDFVANVSHELRTPLTALMGYIETLRGPARDDPAARDRFLATMEVQAQRMNRLVADLLSLSRVEADVRVRPTASVDLGAIIGQAVALLTPVADAAGAAIHVTAPDSPVMLPGDADQLHQVFTNLVENAVKYGGKQVRIDIVREPHMRALHGPGVRVDVVDDGAGIDDVHLPRLTQRFYRADAHRSRAVGGTGLGLAIVKHIVSRHRGRLRISSQTGQGSRFSVLLPTENSTPSRLS